MIVSESKLPTKFSIEEIENPLVRGKNDPNPHLLVTPYDGLKPDAIIQPGVDATGYALPNKPGILLESLNRPINLYRKEIAKDGRPIWRNIGYDPNVSLFQLIEEKRIHQQKLKQNTVHGDSILGGVCYTPPSRMNWLQKLIMYRAENTIEYERRHKLKLRHEWVYQDEK